MIEREILKRLNNDEKGEISLAVSLHNGKVRVDFGKKIDWLEMDPDHMDAFIAILTAKRNELR